MKQLKFLWVNLAILTIVVLDSNITEARDYLSRYFSGPCWTWSGEKCRRICREQGAVSGHCASFRCWCERS